MGRLSYTIEQLREAIKKSSYITETVHILASMTGSKEPGTGPIRKKIKEHNIDISHWIGRKYHKFKRPIEAYLNNEFVVKSTSKFKERLIKEGYIENICSKCGLGDTWQGERIVLQIHHIDGNGHNNNLDNLRILCPNCHSQTDNFTSKSKNSVRTYRKKYYKKK